MKVELSKNELSVIENWYQTAAWESCSLRRGRKWEKFNTQTLELLAKLGFKLNQYDQHILDTPDPTTIKLAHKAKMLSPAEGWCELQKVIRKTKTTA